MTIPIGPQQMRQHPGICAIGLGTGHGIPIPVAAGAHREPVDAGTCRAAVSAVAGAVRRVLEPDSLYFTVTVFATVGFGDITATSQTGRLIVTAQMILDLIVLGLGIGVFLGAVQRGQQDTAQQKTQSR